MIQIAVICNVMMMTVHACLYVVKDHGTMFHLKIKLLICVITSWITVFSSETEEYKTV